MQIENVKLLTVIIFTKSTFLQAFTISLYEN